jgi:hypothetical protein
MSDSLLNLASGVLDSIGLLPLTHLPRGQNGCRCIEHQGQVWSQSPGRQVVGQRHCFNGKPATSNLVGMCREIVPITYDDASCRKGWLDSP